MFVSMRNSVVATSTLRKGSLIFLRCFFKASRNLSKDVSLLNSQTCLKYVLMTYQQGPKDRSRHFFLVKNKS